MIVLLIAALAIVALLAGGIAIARSHAREQQRGERLHVARLTAAAESRAEEDRRRAALEASDAITSVLPAIRLPWPRQPQGLAAHDDGYPSFGDAPRFPAATPFQARDQSAWYRDEPADGLAAGGHQANPEEERPAGYPADRTARPAYPAERAAPGYPADRDEPGSWPDEPLRPVSRPDEQMVPAPRPAGHSAPADCPPRRVAPGSHRGGHAKRRRG
jgi:type II secretory pathway pseudopilin PulG